MKGVRGLGWEEMGIYGEGESKDRPDQVHLFRVRDGTGAGRRARHVVHASRRALGFWARALRHGSTFSAFFFFFYFFPLLCCVC